MPAVNCTLLAMKLQSEPAVHVFDRGEAVRKVLSWRAQAGTVDGVAAHLAAEAVARGNNDNCSVVVVEFVWGAEG